MPKAKGGEERVTNRKPSVFKTRNSVDRQTRVSLLVRAWMIGVQTLGVQEELCSEVPGHSQTHS